MPHQSFFQSRLFSAQRIDESLVSQWCNDPIRRFHIRPQLNLPLLHLTIHSYPAADPARARLVGPVPLHSPFHCADFGRVGKGMKKGEKESGSAFSTLDQGDCLVRRRIARCRADDDLAVAPTRCKERQPSGGQSPLGLPVSVSWRLLPPADVLVALAFPVNLGICTQGQGCMLASPVAIEPIEAAGFRRFHQKNVKKIVRSRQYHPAHGNTRINPSPAVQVAAPSAT
jgi:hypothetical protein